MIVLIVTPLGGQIWGLVKDPSAERLSALLSSSTMWLPGAIIGLMVLHTLVPLPAELLALAAGMTLGPFWGFVTTWVGAMLGAYLGFFLARALGRPVMQCLSSSPRLERLQWKLQHAGIPLLLAIRLLPIISFNLINYALGLTTISWWRFTWTTGTGIVPVTVFVVIFGAHLGDWRVLALMLCMAVAIGLGGYAVLRYCRVTLLS